MYVCEKPCQVRIKGKIVTFRRGEVTDLESEHPHFRNLENGEIDFETAEEEELLEADYELNDLKTFIKERFGVSPRNRNRENTIAMLLDCRFRDLSDSDLERLE